MDITSILDALRSDPHALSLAEIQAATGRSRQWALYRLGYGVGAGLLSTTQCRHNKAFWMLAVAGGAPGVDISVSSVSRKAFLPPKNVLIINKENKRESKGDKESFRTSAARKKKALPRLRMPADGSVDQVLALSRLWDQAARNQSRNQQRGAWFRDFQPWKNPRQRYAWNAFVLMNERLREKVISPCEYLAAVMPYYYKLPRGQRSLYRVIGKFGFDTLWPEWQKKRRAEGNGGVQGEQRVQAAAALATQSAEEALRINLRDAYRECQERGPVQAPTLLWGAEVLWLMWTTEPATHPGIKHQFSMLTAEEEPVWRQEWRRIAGDKRQQVYLLGLRKWVVKTDAAILVEEGGNEDERELGVSAMQAAGRWWDAELPGGAGELQDRGERAGVHGR